MEKNNEPIVTVAAISAAVAAIIALLVAFGINLTADQTAAIMGVVAVAAPFIVAAIARKFTVSLNRVAAYEKKETDVVIAGPAAPQVDGTEVAVVASRANGL